jgi:hypothetical protein
VKATMSTVRPRAIASGQAMQFSYWGIHCFPPRLQRWSKN